MGKGKVALTGLFGCVALLTALLTWAFDGAHNGRIAGNEALALAGAWGLSGGVAAWLRSRGGPTELRNGARILFAAGLLYLLLGALLGNSRWAEPWARLVGYGGAIGAVWAGEWLFLRSGDLDEADAGRLLGLTAAAAGFGAAAFEVVRWLEPAFTLEMGATLTPELYAEQMAVKGLWTAAVWAPYGLAVTSAGVRLASLPTRQLGTVMLAAAWTYFGFALLRHGTGPGWLLALSFVSAAACTLGAWRLYRLWPRSSQGSGDQQISERPPA